MTTVFLIFYYFMMLQDRLVHTILKMGYVLHQLINPLFLKLEVLIANNKIL